MQKSKFHGLMVRLASAETIEQRSCGAVEHADTINYRTGKPKPKGLFCESIFGPVKNYECSCGKYKGVRYKGIVCERCGVEVASARVRRERMGHIDLASPVVHVWYQNSISGGIHHLLGISGGEIQKILSFVKYILIKPVTQKEKEIILERLQKDYENAMKKLDALYEQEKQECEKSKQKEIALKELKQRYDENVKSINHEFYRLKSIAADLHLGSTILESDYRNVFYKFDDLVVFKSGPQAIYEMLKQIDVEKEIKQKLQQFRTIKSAEQKKKAFALIKLLINLYVSGVQPHNMMITKLPVIPPDLRPVVQLEGGKFASSDVNLFYRRVLMRNIRLKKMIQVGMPEVVKKNEIRLLQEAVNNLFIGEKNTSAKAGAGVKLFKSLSDMLSGKEGIFRKNLLGKRVDYSGRSVITVGPTLKLEECGVPLYIAMKIFTPFVIGKLIEKKIAYTPKQAEKIIKEGNPLALKFLEEVIKDKYVLLNRAPTLHRLSIEAFKIKLMPGKTIRLHPLVCGSFNADFDGDQMAIHLPISEEAQREARELIAATKNILKPASGEPTISHDKDMVLGIYYLTDDKIKSNKLIGTFHINQLDKVLEYFYRGDANVKDTVKLVSPQGEVIQTTVGRVVFNAVLPESLRFINTTIGKKQLKQILNRVYDEMGQEETVKIADAIKDLGFKYSTISTTSINMIDITLPKNLKEIIKTGDEKADKIYTAYYKGFLSEDEKHRLIIETWMQVKDRVEGAVKDSMFPGEDLYTMVDSGAKGNIANLTQIRGMKGLVLNPQGEVIELPVKGNYLEGLGPIEYFISIHASRKGKADTALKTAESGYLTRKLCDACQEVIIREEDCHTEKYVLVSKDACKVKGDSFEEMLYGRVLARDLVDKDGKIVAHKGDIITKELLAYINDNSIEDVYIRSPLTCMTIKGICQKCYGIDLATRKLVELGTPVGIIAAQSIGEPATQLTMRTYHVDVGGSVAGKEDMTQGIDRVKQLFEVRTPKNPAIIAPFDGKMFIVEDGKMRTMILESDYQKKTYLIKDGYKCVVKKGDVLPKGGVYAVAGKSKLQVKEQGEVLEVHQDHIVIGVKEIIKKSLVGLTPFKQKDGERIMKGEILTSGAVDIREYQAIVGDLAAQNYIIDGVKAVYLSQGQSLNNKHIELVVKQLFSKVFVEDAGDSSFIPGTHVKYEEFEKVNAELRKQGKKEAKGKRLALGLTTIAKETDSWLSAASFQETIRVMVDASLRGAIDQLDDLKSNVIIGRLLPIGEVYRKQKEEEEEEQEEMGSEEM